MVHAMSALRKRKSLILDTCEIFIREPLLDWVKDAKMKNNVEGVPDQSVVGSSIPASSDYENELKELAWYPKKKIDIVRAKLYGMNPVRVQMKELKDSRHGQRSYIRVLLQAVEGPEGSVRNHHFRGGNLYLDPVEQVDCLIEQARDPNLLGRTWIGWSPFV